MLSTKTKIRRQHCYKFDTKKVKNFLTNIITSLFRKRKAFLLKTVLINDYQDSFFKPLVIHQPIYFWSRPKTKKTNLFSSLSELLIPPIKQSCPENFLFAKFNVDVNEFFLLQNNYIKVCIFWIGQIWRFCFPSADQSQA